MREHDGYPVGSRVRALLVLDNGELFTEVVCVVLRPAQRYVHRELNTEGGETNRGRSVYGQPVQIVESDKPSFPSGKKIFVGLTFLRPLHEEVV